MTRSIALFVLLAAPSGAVFSGAGRLSKPPEASTAERLGVSRNLSLMGFTLGRTTIAEVQAKLGKSVIRRSSQADSASDTLCYESAGGDRTRVVFFSGFSGGWTVVDGFKVIAKGASANNLLRCAKTRRVTSGIETAGGLKLGLTREQVFALLGSPAKTGQNSLVYEWESRQPMTSQQIRKEADTFKEPVTRPYYDVEDVIMLTLRDGKVATFLVRHTVTY